MSKQVANQLGRGTIKFCLSKRYLKKVFDVQGPSERLAALYNSSGCIPPSDAEPDLNPIKDSQTIVIQKSLVCLLASGQPN